MNVIYMVLILVALVTGIAAGVILTITHYQAVQDQQHAEEEELAEQEELYAARAAVRAGIRRPPSGSTWPQR